MDIKETIYGIIEKYDNGSIDECIGDIESYLKNNENIKYFIVHPDTDVYDSCGLDVYYISVSWVDLNGVLDMCGAKLERY